MTLGFECDTSPFDQLAVLHSRGTGRLTGAALKTEGDVLREHCEEGLLIDPALHNRPHQCNAASRRIHLCPKQAIGRTGLQTQAAVDTLVEQLTVLWGGHPN